MFHDANELTAWLHENSGFWVWILCLISRRGVIESVSWFRKVTRSAETVRGLVAEAELGWALERHHSKGTVTCKDVERLKTGRFWAKSEPSWYQLSDLR
jgi:hypothetical protein